MDPIRDLVPGAFSPTFSPVAAVLCAGKEWHQPLTLLAQLQFWLTQTLSMLPQVFAESQKQLLFLLGPHRLSHTCSYSLISHSSHF